MKVLLGRSTGEERLPRDDWNSSSAPNIFGDVPHPRVLRDVPSGEEELNRVLLASESVQSSEVGGVGLVFVKHAQETPVGRSDRDELNQHQQQSHCHEEALLLSSHLVLSCCFVSFRFVSSFLFFSCSLILFSFVLLFLPFLFFPRERETERQRGREAQTNSNGSMRRKDKERKNKNKKNDNTLPRSKYPTVQQIEKQNKSKDTRTPPDQSEGEKKKKNVKEKKVFFLLFSFVGVATSLLGKKTKQPNN